MFDENGFYETDKEFLINILKQHFDIVNEEETMDDISDQYTEDMRNENNAPRDDIKHCKKCEFTCTNQGDLLAHYREHKKSEGAK
jgi:hypothetical protein